MKTLTTLLAAAAIFASPALHAADAAGDGTNTAGNSWAVGLVGVAVVATVGAVVGVYSSSSPSTFSH